VNRKADFFYKTNRLESIHITNRMESIRIANWNALVPAACAALRSAYWKQGFGRQGWRGGANTIAACMLLARRPTNHIQLKIFCLIQIHLSIGATMAIQLRSLMKAT